MTGEVSGRDDYTISTDPRHLDLDAIQRYLSSDSYWASGIPRHIVAKALAHSLNFGVYHGAPGSALVAYARVVTDRATFAWLCDVFVLPEHRGRGLSKWLLEVVLAHPDLQELRNFVLATRDAQGLYARFGFAPLAEPARWMALRRRPRSYGGSA